MVPCAGVASDEWLMYVWFDPACVHPGCLNWLASFLGALCSCTEKCSYRTTASCIPCAFCQEEIDLQ
jgi:hypothetical protein